VENNLHITDGIALNQAIIICISNTSMSGMSGSPILVKEGTTWKICGFLLGDPPVKAQRELCELGGLIKKPFAYTIINTDRII
jgi:hypothetical protein